MKIYISGKVTGFPIDAVSERFSMAESFLLDAGFDVVNPLKNGLAVSEPWERHIIKDIELLMGCEAIYMLDCWRSSRGARIEYNVALESGKYILFESAIINRDLSIMMLQNAIHEVTGLKFGEYDNDSRKQDCVFARMIFIHHCRKNNKMKLSEISKYIHRTHSAILHLLNVYDDEYRFNKGFRAIADKVDGILRKQS